jgi:Domain of unknown function (DUF4382)
VLSFGYHLRNTLTCTALFTVFAFYGCGDSCFVAFSNNGNGGVIIKAGNPLPACSLTQTNGIMSVVAIKSSACATCLPASRAEHVFVTLRGLQVRPRDTDGAARAADWQEIAPKLVSEPRQIELTSNSLPEILVTDVLVPAGSYDQLRLQFLTSSAASAPSARAENSCAGGFWNCAVMANGRTQVLEQPDLLIPLEYQGNALLVWPASRMELQIDLSAETTGPYLGSPDEGMLRTLLLGRANVVRQFTTKTD